MTIAIGKLTPRLSLVQMAAPIVIGLMMTIGTVSMATACEGEEVLFEDSFDDNLSGWPFSEERGGIADGAYTLSPKPDKTYSSLLATFFFEDADICLDVTLVEGETVEAGLLYWGEDYDNFFQFVVNAKGNYEIYRLKDDKWNKIAVESAGDALKPGMDVTNRLRVTLDGNTATFYINDTQVHKIRAQRPKGETKIGVYVGGTGEATRRARFTDIIVTNVSDVSG